MGKALLSKQELSLLEFFFLEVTMLSEWESKSGRRWRQVGAGAGAGAKTGTGMGRNNGSGLLSTEEPSGWDSGQGSGAGVPSQWVGRCLWGG